MYAILGGAWKYSLQLVGYELVRAYSQEGQKWKSDTFATFSIDLLRRLSPKPGYCLAKKKIALMIFDIQIRRSFVNMLRYFES
jgi:hypothetical protein